MFFLRFDAFPVLLPNLANLKYLALNVTYELNASMSELWKLQSLIIYGPWSDNEESPILSLKYWSMPWLRHLHVRVPSSLRNSSICKQVLPQSLGPRYLQTLSTIIFSSCTPEVFSIMCHLKKLGIFETKEDYDRDPSSECLKNLAGFSEILELVPKMKDKIDSIGTELMEFSRMMDERALGQLRKDFGAQRNCCLPMKVVFFFKKLAKLILSLYQELDYFLAFVKDSENLEKYLMDNSLESNVKLWIDSSILVLGHVSRTGGCLETVLIRSFDQENGACQILFQSLEEINSKKKEVQIIWSIETIGTKHLQVVNTSCRDFFFFYLGFKFLRVLDIVFLHFDSFPIQVVVLTNLRYIALTATDELPKSISKMSNLQTSIIHRPWINKKDRKNPTLLLGYWKMPGLRHLHLSVPFCFPSPCISVSDHALGTKSLQTVSTISFSSCTKEVFSACPN
ncbi:hypothetical protein ACH5RR_030084 [Cinchona calisaya]|uniref:Uncharacterized protein n=1 Tax=Cinchona calisaya TaxID=153742 RepID=A0ABD2YWU0_9GENT